MKGKDNKQERGRKMNEAAFVPYYSKIANQLNCMVPEEWSTIVMYGEELGDNRTAVFYFKTEEDGEYIAGGNIPDIYKVDKDIYFELILELCGQIKELKDEFIRQGLPEWKTITFYLDKNFKFKAEYDYDIPMEVGSFERITYFAYDKLGIMPKSNLGKKILNEYLEQKG